MPKLNNYPMKVRKIRKSTLFGTGFLVLTLSFWVLSFVKNKQNKKNYLLVIRWEYASENSNVKVISFSEVLSFSVLNSN